MKRSSFIVIFIIILSFVQAQEPSKFEFKGYVKDLQNVFIPKPDSIN